jgi:hypothetical protein
MSTWFLAFPTFLWVHPYGRATGDFYEWSASSLRSSDKNKGLASALEVSVPKLAAGM